MQRQLTIIWTSFFFACGPTDRSSLDEQSLLNNIPKINRTPSEDSLILTIPAYKFENVDVYFGFDSVRAVHGQPPKFQISNVKQSTRVQVVPEMFEKSNEIIGAFKCRDSLDVYQYYPFKLRDINYR
jgi:hypothetical protein